MNRLFIIILLLCYSCNNSINKKERVAKQDTSHAIIITGTSKIDSTKEDQDNDSDDDDKPVVVIYHTTYDSSKSLLQNLKTGWLDTHVIDNQRFRLRYDTAVDKKEFCVEQWTGSAWKNLFYLYISDDEYTWGDINDDGYIDFVKFYHRSHYTYFYNPVTRTISKDECVMPEEYTVVDTANRLMYNYYEAMYGNTFPSSQLYTYKNLDAYFYYSLYLIDTAVNDFKEIKLYKHNNGRYNDTTFVRIIASGKNVSLDYKKFWSKNYKELLQH